MKIFTSRREVSGLPAAALGVAVRNRPRRAQTYPSQDIHFICGFAAGSGADIIVRFYR